LRGEIPDGSEGGMLQIHVSKDDLKTVRAVSVSPAPLADGAARLQIKLFGLSANNITYAAMGTGPLGYWDFFPGPVGWGCPPGWGLADVTESRATGVEVGARYYGYYPVAETLDVFPTRISSTGFSDGVAHRAAKAAIYNRYHLTSADPQYASQFEREQVLFRPVFGAGWWLADFVHQGNPQTVVMSSATSKSALVAAMQLRKLGKHRLVGLTSGKNIAYLHGAGLFDHVISYDEAASVTASGPASYVDFLGRESLRSKVHEVLGERLTRSVIFGATDWADKSGGVQSVKSALPGPAPEFFFTPSYRESRIAEQPSLGAAMQRDILEFYSGSRRFVTITHRHGVDEIVAAWMKLLSGDVAPSEGLTFQF
jgi:hypothetical protein